MILKKITFVRQTQVDQDTKKKKACDKCDQKMIHSIAQEKKETWKTYS